MEFTITKFVMPSPECSSLSYFFNNATYDEEDLLLILSENFGAEAKLVSN